MARSRIAAAALSVFGATVATGLTSTVHAQGSLFTTAEVDETKFVLVAAPIGSGERSQLNIYEQRTSARPCYAVSGSAPATVVQEGPRSATANPPLGEQGCEASDCLLRVWARVRASKGA